MADHGFLLLDDALWIDFLNTAVTPPGARDVLADAGTYQLWTRACQLPTDPDSLPFDQVLDFRERLRALAESLDAGRRPPPSAVEAINRVLEGAPGRARLGRVGGRWRELFLPDEPPRAFQAIARSAASTLTDQECVVRRCAPDCGLYYTEPRPGPSRSWCGLPGCPSGLRLERRRPGRLTPVL